MRKNLGFIFKSILFICMVAAVLLGATKLLTLKAYYGDGIPNTTTYKGFYELPKNSVDVLFLGSSHGADGFVPQVMYDNYGLTAYNLSCGQQSLLVSFYWLKEALRYQKPKVVVLDTYMLYTYSMDEPLNAPETAIRQAIDPMKWSMNKLRAVKAICENDPSQKISSYMFPLERYHSRWTDLSRKDFLIREYESNNELMGYAYSPYGLGIEYAGLDISIEEEPSYINDVMRKYMDEIVWLCNTNDIQLVLVKTPATQETLGRYYGTKEYAEANNLPFLEMNTHDVFDALQYDFPNDMGSGGHANIKGAIKITDYIGKWITDNCAISRSEIDESAVSLWDRNHNYFSNVLDNAKISLCTDSKEYIDLINDPRFIVLIAVNSSTNYKNDEFVNALGEMGIDTNLEFGDSYYAVIGNNGIIQESSHNSEVKYSGIIEDRFMDYQILSCGVNTLREECSIKIDGKEYAKDLKGYNIVIYDTVTKSVVDSICYDGQIIK